LDIDGVITFVNDSVSLLGYVPEDLIGKHYSVLLHDDDAAVVDRDRVLPDYAGYRTGLALSPKLFNERRSIDRRTTDLEVRLKRNPGVTGAAREVIGSVISYGEVSSAGEYCRDDQKNFKGSVGIIRDITLRRKSEEMLRKLYQAVDQLGSCVFVLNHAFEVEYVNPAFFILTGFSPPDVIGRSVFRFFAFMPDKVDRLSKRVQDGFETREEVLVPRASGGQFWANFSIAPVRAPLGAITHAIVVVDDVSSRKSMEELLRNARRESEDASKAKSRFLSSMTHELKNPIIGIISAARILQLDNADVEGKAVTILENAQVLLDILTGILDYVRSENFDGTIQRLSFPLVPFMERSCAKYRALAVEKGLEFSLEVGSEDSIESDPDRLGRVVEILVDNAVKYTERGSVAVKAAIERREGNVPHLIVSVSDTGSGIETGDRDLVFRPFAKTDRERRNASKGGGVGLALAKNIAMVLGGEIRLDSVPGSGSVFTIVVPAASPVRSASAVANRYTVLVVDDNDVYLEYMRTLIENCGFRVQCASGAAEAFGVLESRYVDAALLDIQMPDYSGLELAKAIRSYAGARYSPSMPLFAMTAQDSEAIGADAGLFDGVFQKPTDIKKFAASLCRSMAELESGSGQSFLDAFAASGFGRVAAIARIKMEVEASMSALTLALSGTSDARVDVRAKVSALSSIFKRFSCRRGQEMLNLFIQHYSEEDKDVLLGLLERIGIMFESGIAVAAAGRDGSA
jgi:PAS domain S-box-containing protein